MRRFLCLPAYFLLSLCSLSAQGQNISDKLVREYEPSSHWLVLRYDYYLENGSFFFLENESRFKKEESYFGKSFPFNSIYRTYLMGGYEHKAADKWYLGLSARYVAVANIQSPHSRFLYSRMNISHRGDFLKMKLIKEAALEHINKLVKSDNPNIVIQNEGRFSFAPSLVKKTELKGKPLFFILHYRAYLLFDFINDGFSSYDKRKIDKTRLRFEVDYRISDKILLSLFAMRDTDYTYRIATFGPFQNVLKEEARVNRVTPTFGMSINFVMNAPEDYLPGFPLK